MCVWGRGRDTRRALVPVKGKGHSKKWRAKPGGPLGVDVDHWVRQPCLPCSLDPSTADPFVLAASCNTGHFIFKSPLCTRTNASNYPISVLSLHPTQKTQMPRKLRKPRFKQYHMLFLSFHGYFSVWAGLGISRAANSIVFMSARCWVSHLRAANTNMIIILDVVKGTALSSSPSSPPPSHHFPRPLQGIEVRWTDKATFNLTLLPFARAS